MSLSTRSRSLLVHSLAEPKAGSSVARLGRVRGRVRARVRVGVRTRVRVRARVKVRVRVKGRGRGRVSSVARLLRSVWLLDPLSASTVMPRVSFARVCSSSASAC
eukprot:scaffold60900_cov35-Phaeocystis_antarctica.AAC.1